MDIFLSSTYDVTLFISTIDKLQPSSIVILSDEHTEKFCLPVFTKKYMGNRTFHTITISSGEKEKNLSSAEHIWKELIDLNTDKKCLIVNLGGGVITDLGGFVASLYKRGCNFIHIPTSLLAIVDAAIGGKNGVDFGYLKNIIGVIKNPQFTWIDTEFLHSLPEDEIKSGWAEIIKHALIFDKELWQQIQQQDHLEIPNDTIIEKAILVKEKIVTEDPEEYGLRKVLNYGHTVGHAIESFALANKKEIKHGHAVILGILIENLIAVEKGILNIQTANTIATTLTRHYSTNFDFEIESVVKNTFNDKKNWGNTIRMSLIEDVGVPLFDIICSEAEIVAALEKYRKIYF